MASLQLLCQQGIATAVKEEKDVAKLTMPSRLCSYVTTAFIPTIKVTPRRRFEQGRPRMLAENVTFNINNSSLTCCSYYLLNKLFWLCERASQADVVALSATHPRSQQHARLCELPDGRK